jgi:hypothetical protein
MKNSVRYSMRYSMEDIDPLRRYRTRPMKRKRKSLWLGLALGGASLAGVLAVTVAFALASFRYVEQAVANTTSLWSVEQVKGELTQRTAVLTSERCLNGALQLLDLRPWLEKPPVQNLEALRAACWQGTAAPGNRPVGQGP